MLGNPCSKKSFKHKPGTALSRAAWCLKNCIKKWAGPGNLTGPFKVLFYHLNLKHERHNSVSNSLLFSIIIFLLSHTVCPSLESCPFEKMLSNCIYWNVGCKGERWACRPLTIGLVVECHELYPMKPEHDGVRVGELTFVECSLCARHYAKHGTSLASSYLILTERSTYNKGRNVTNISNHISLGSSTNGCCLYQCQVASWSQS